MVIKLSNEEQELVKEGTLNINDIEEYRKDHPLKEPDLSEIEKVKQEIRDTNVLYRDSIQKNKDLYDELLVNRKKKEEYRNKITELRTKKKELLAV